MPNCMVETCAFSWRTKSSEITLHVFPRSKDMIRMWLQEIKVYPDRIEDLTEKISIANRGVYRICSTHFSDESYEMKCGKKLLKKDAYPTLNLPTLYETASEVSGEHSYCKRIRLESTLETSAGSQELDESSMHSQLSSSISQDATSLDQLEMEYVEHHDLGLPEYVIESSLETTLSTGDNSTLITKRTALSTGDNRDQITKRKRKYASRTIRTVATNTDLLINKMHRTTQCNQSLFLKNKKVQVHRHKRHMSIGIQCDLAELPPLMFQAEDLPSVKTPVEAESLHHDVLHSSSIESDNSPTDSFADEEKFTPSSGFGTFYKNEQLNLLPPIRAPQQGGCNITDQYMSDSEADESIERHTFEESCRPSLEEEEQRHINLKEEQLQFDPNDPDSSFILLPEKSESSNYALEKKYIVFDSCLNELLRGSRCRASNSCKGCIAKLIKYTVGSALVVNAVCTHQHKFRLWCSQPFIGCIPAGNLLISSAILCSGSNFQKVNHFLSILSIPAISQSTHCSNQQKFIFPTIKHHWKTHRQNLIESMEHRAVAVAGDGHCDSPGYREKYCIYTMMDLDTHKILDFQVEQLQTDVSSIALEKKAFSVVLDRLLYDDVNIKIVATGRHVGIQKIMKDNYRSIQQQFDIWHFAKSLGNKLYMASRKRNCRQLAAWVSHAKNHLWWAASTCHRNPALLKEKWLSICYHVSNCHDWDDMQLYHRCQHAPLSEKDIQSTEWLEVGSAAHHKLVEICNDKRLIKDLEHLSNFCHAWDLEVYHGMALKYRSKKHNFFVDSMEARCRLAALDHNFNIDTLQAVVKRINTYNEEPGSLSYTYSFSKARKEWLVSKMYEHNSHGFVFDIMADTLSYSAGKKKYI